MPNYFCLYYYFIIAAIVFLLLLFNIISWMCVEDFYPFVPLLWNSMEGSRSCETAQIAADHTFRQPTGQPISGKRTNRFRVSELSVMSEPLSKIQV